MSAIAAVLGSTTTSPANAPTLAEIAAQAATVTADLTSAREAARKAKHDAIAAILDILRPAWELITRRPRIAEGSGNDPLRTYADEGKTLADWRGVRIAGDGPEKDGKRDDTRGSTSGTALYWCDNGTFRTLTYDGHWSRWQGEGSSWTAEVEEHDDLDTALETWPEIDPEDLAKRIQTKIAKALDEARGRQTTLVAAAESSKRIADAVKGSTSATGPESNPDVSVMVEPSPDVSVMVEHMPDHLKASHRAAGNWGIYPHNGAVRERMTRADADDLVASDEDGYARIITTAVDEAQP